MTCLCMYSFCSKRVVQLSALKYTKTLYDKCSSSIKSVHNIEWVCHTCNTHIEEGKIPEYYIGSHMKLTEDSQAEVIGT